MDHEVTPPPARHFPPRPTCIPANPAPTPATPSILPTCANPRHLRSCREAILVHDEGAASLAGSVLARLKGLHHLPKESEMELIQGYVRLLRSKGFGAAIHTALGPAVKYQVPASDLHSLSLSHPHLQYHLLRCNPMVHPVLHLYP